MSGAGEPAARAPGSTPGSTLESGKLSLGAGLGVVLVIAFVSAIGVLFFHAIPKSNEQLITYMLGQLSGFVGGVVAYHYTLNKLNEKASQNTRELAQAMQAQATAIGAGTGAA